MYHQFKELANIDITEEAMEVGPTTHYAMGGIRVDPDSQMSTVPGLFAAGECAAGLHGANRLGGNSLSDLLVFGKRSGKYAANFAKENNFGQINNDQVKEVIQCALAPFERTGKSNEESPYHIQSDLQKIMQRQVGIVRKEEELLNALEEIAKLRDRATRAASPGNREYNPGWHTALDLPNLLLVSEAIARSAIERKESRGAQAREDYSSKDEAFSKINMVAYKGSDGEMKVEPRKISAMPDDLKQIIEEMK